MENKMIKINEKDFEISKDGRGTTYLTHNFHSYPAKFIPQIPKITISKFTNEGDVILDPFGGCGTTMVEAKLLNRRGVAVDLNPVGVLVSKTKTTKLNEKQINKIPSLLEEIKRDINNSYAGKKIKIIYKIPPINNLDHWFKKDIAKELAIIKSYLEKIKDSSLRNYLYTAFSSIIVNVSNQESDTRFAAIDKKTNKQTVFEEFVTKINKMNPRILEFSSKASNSEIKIYEGDARNLDFLEDNSVDHVVTSPPYANTYDYYLYHKFRILWLGNDLKRVQDNEIGSRNRHSSKKEGIETFENELNLCLKEINRVLKPKKYAVFVIGDSVIRGELIRADSLLKQIAKKNNLELIKKISYNLRKNSKMFNPKFTNGEKEEHIMFFQNIKDE